MVITSPFFVVPLFAITFIVCILWGTSSKDESETHSTH